MSNPERPPEHWDEFEAMIDLHKFYFDQILKSAGVGLATVTALTAFIAKDLKSAETALLALPMLFAAAAGAVFWVGSRKAREFSHDVDTLRTAWGYRWRPHTELLGWMALIFAVTFSLLAVGMAVYLLR